MSLPGVTTLLTMRTLAAQRCDMPTPSTTTFITTSEWNSYINGSYYLLYNLMVMKYAENYYAVTNYQFTTNGTAELYPLPDGSSTYKLADGVTTAPAFFKMLGVDLWINAAATQPAQWITLHRFNYGQRNQYTPAGSLAPWGYVDIRYRIEGSNLWLRPTATSGQLIQTRYVPRLTPLVNDGDTADLVSGWEEFIVVDAARKAALKEESFEQAAMLETERLYLEKQIEASADNRDPGEPQTVVDVQGANQWVWRGGSGGGF